MNKNQIKSTVSFLFVLQMILVFCAELYAAEISYPELEKSIKQQNYQLAYQQAIRLRPQNEGEPRFDYLYGLSALQTGHYNEAVFALDRVVVISPRVIRPRLDLSRAYLKLNNKSAAIKEFQDVLKLAPPPVVRKKVNKYIAELTKKDHQLVRKSVVKRSATFSVGYDDNINFGFDDELIDLPGLGVFRLDSSSVKQGSGFAETLLQIRRKNLIDRKSGTFATANLKHRDYFKNGDFNLSDIDLRVGYLLNKNNRQYQLIARDRPIFLGGKLYTNILGFDAIASQSVGVGKILSSSFSLEKYDHKIISLADRARAFLTANFDAQSGSIQHRVSSYIGKEWPDDDLGKQYSRNISGIGYKATQSWNVKNKSFVALDYRHYKHQASSAISPLKRSDDRTVMKIGHEWQLNDKTAVIFSARHINNHSNLNLYDAKRNEFKVGIRYEWD